MFRQMSYLAPRGEAIIHHQRHTPLTRLNTKRVGLRWTTIDNCLATKRLFLPILMFEAPASEFYDDTGRNPALTVLGFVVKLGHNPVGLHQANSDPFPKPDV